MKISRSFQNSFQRRKQINNNQERLSASFPLFELCLPYMHLKKAKSRRYIYKTWINSFQPEQKWFKNVHVEPISYGSFCCMKWNTSFLKRIFLTSTSAVKNISVLALILQVYNQIFLFQEICRTENEWILLCSKFKLEYKCFIYF